MLHTRFVFVYRRGLMQSQKYISLVCGWWFARCNMKYMRSKKKEKGRGGRTLDPKANVQGDWQLHSLNHWLPVSRKKERAQRDRQLLDWMVEPVAQVQRGQRCRQLQLLDWMAETYAQMQRM